MEPQKEKEVLELISQELPEYFHMTHARLIGKCKSCNFESLYCCHRNFSKGMSVQDDFLHVCLHCYWRDFSSRKQQEDPELDLDAAICPFCGYNWSTHNSK